MAERDTPILPFIRRPSPLKGVTPWCPDRDETMPLPAADTGHAKSADHPFAMAEFLSTELAALHGYWNLLKRGNADVPFTDDFSFAALGDTTADIALVHVFQNPQRFRFDMAGGHVAQVYGDELENRFADEVRPRAPLDYFIAQCATTVESAAPSLYSHPRIDGAAEYHRLMLPLWGDGHVNAILAVFDIRGESDAV